MQTKGRRIIRLCYLINIGLALTCAIGILIGHSREFIFQTTRLHIGLTATTLWLDVIQGDESDILKVHAQDGRGSYGFNYCSYRGIKYLYFLEWERLWPSLAYWKQKPPGLIDRLINNGPKFKRPIYHTTVSMPLIFIMVIALILAGVARWVIPDYIRPGLCKFCRYDLTGNQSGICPECGTVILRTGTNLLT